MGERGEGDGGSGRGNVVGSQAEFLPVSSPREEGQLRWPVRGSLNFDFILSTTHI